MSFCTAINCMDGRVQLPVINFLMRYFEVDFVDSITEPGPNLILSENADNKLVDSIFNRLDISVNKHGSSGIAIVGHYDCAGNPSSKKEQLEQINNSINLIKSKFNKIKIIGLWVDENFDVKLL